MSDVASPEDRARFEAAFREGWDAYEDGKDELDNPYEDADHEAAWHVGWAKAAVTATDPAIT